MALPRLIEYILSLDRPGGGNLAEHGLAQVIVPVFPAGLQLASVLEPSASSFALIGYRLQFGRDMVPNAFSGTIQHYGRNQYNGIVTQAAIEIELTSWMVITRNIQVRYSFTNRTALNQRIELMTFYVDIHSADDFDLIMAHLLALENGGATALKEEAEDLLAKMRPARARGT